MWQCIWWASLYSCLTKLMTVITRVDQFSCMLKAHLSKCLDCGIVSWSNTSQITTVTPCINELNSPPIAGVQLLQHLQYCLVLAFGNLWPDNTEWGRKWGNGCERVPHWIKGLYQPSARLCLICLTMKGLTIGLFILYQTTFIQYILLPNIHTHTCTISHASAQNALAKTLTGATRSLSSHYH